MGDPKGAGASFRKALDADPEHGSAKHMLASLSGSTTAGPPVDYVTDLFDKFAPRFDDLMLEKFSYTSPRLCRDILDRAGEDRGSDAVPA